jgi:outer membrane immunogenic protein
MKKLVLALTAIAAFTGSAVAADLPARTYSKAPVYVEPTPSWTGFYIFGGGGYGMWNADTNLLNNPGLVPVTRDVRQGGSGYFGTVGAGYDWQFSGPWVAGVFADGQFGSIRGSLNNALNIEGRETLRDSWAAGVRVGYLVAPNVYSYVNGGYTGSQWSGTSMSSTVLGAPGGAIATTPSFTRDGWFIGGGVENNLDIFGIHIPGLFMKTEYRASSFNRITLPETFVASGLPDGFADTFKPWVQTVSTSLVYRFNWSGAPVSAKY